MRNVTFQNYHAPTTSYSDPRYPALHITRMDPGISGGISTWELITVKLKILQC